MRIRLQNELLFIIILTIVLIIIVTFFPITTLRVILGLPFMLFFPGYTLVSALFPRRDALDNIERVALSFGLSLALVPLIGLIVNYTPWAIGLYPILISLTAFIIVTSIIAWQRRRRLAKSERFTVNLNLAAWHRRNYTDKILTAIFIVFILGALGTLVYAIATPKANESFTEFYILGPVGKAIDYPRYLEVREVGRVTVDIINREHEIVSYRLEVMIDGIENHAQGPLVLRHDEGWERIISFVPDRAGDNQKVEFLLYKNEESEPYLKLYLWIDVKE